MNEMTLASDAISVPIPPMLTPISNSAALSVNPDMRIAAGTLLIIWLNKAENSKVFLSAICISNFDIVSILWRLPMKMKKKRNVSNSE
nr:hypothetical protein [Teretinema zuelzerae]